MFIWHMCILDAHRSGIIQVIYSVCWVTSIIPLTAMLQCKNHFCPHLTEEPPESQRGEQGMIKESQLMDRPWEELDLEPVWSQHTSSERLTRWL